MLEEEVVVEVPNLPQVDESVSRGEEVRRGLALGHEHRELGKKRLHCLPISDLGNPFQICFFFHAWLWKADGALTMSSLKRAPPPLAAGCGRKELLLLL